MLLRYYRSIGPGSILLVILTGVLLWMYQFISPAQLTAYYSENAMPLFLFFDSVLGDSAFARSVSGFILVLIIAFYLSNFNTRLFFITERTLLPSSVYVILSGFFINLQTFNPVLPATLLLIIAIDRVIGSYRKPGIAYNYFDASLLLGLASMFYANVLWLFPIIIIAILIIRTLYLREIFLSVFGLITPYLVALAIYYIGGHDLSIIKDRLINNILKGSPAYLWTTADLIAICTGALIIIISLVHLLGRYNTKKIRTRKIFSLLIWMLVFALATFFLVPGASVELFYIVLIPASYLLSHFLVFVRNKKIANIVFAIVCILIVGLQVLRIYNI